MCLVVDECHKAVGKSDLVTVVAKLRAERCKFRLLGLSATPGATRQAVQACLCLCANLMLPAPEALHALVCARCCAA